MKLTAGIFANIFPLCALMLYLHTDDPSTGIDIISVARAEDTPELVTVEVEGFGTTPDDARKNALRAALQEAVGTLVDETTAVANDKLISNSILTYSDGLIERVETLQEPTQDRNMGGIYRCKIRAVVKRGDVAKRLEAIPMASSAVAGDQLWAQSVSKVQGVEDGRKLLIEFQKNRPIDRLLVARVVDKEGNPVSATGLERTPNYDKGTTTLHFAIQVFEDSETYFTRYAAPLISLLDKIGTVKEASISLTESVIDSNQRQDRTYGGLNCVENPFYKIQRDFYDTYKNESPMRGVVIVTGRNSDGSNIRVRLVDLEKTAYKTEHLPDHPFGANYRMGIRLSQVIKWRVTLLDPSGRTIQVQEGEPLKNRYSNAHSYMPGAGFLAPEEGNYVPKLCTSVIFPFTMDIPNSDLRNVSAIAVEMLPAVIR